MMHNALFTATLLAQLGYGRVDVLGYSWGGLVASSWHCSIPLGPPPRPGKLDRRVGRPPARAMCRTHADAAAVLLERVLRQGRSVDLRRPLPDRPALVDDQVERRTAGPEHLGLCVTAERGDDVLEPAGPPLIAARP